MKKKLFLGCFLSIVGVLSYCLFFPIQPEPAQYYYADYLPEETVAVLSLYDMEGLSEKFSDMPLGRFLARPLMHAMMKELGATEEDTAGYDGFYNAVADIMTNPIVHRIFGDDAVIALCPLNSERLQEKPEQEVKNAFLAFGTSASAGPISWLARMTMGKDVSKAEKADLNMTQIRLDENEVLYGYDHDGIILLAYDPEKIAKAVQRRKTGKALHHFALFAAATDALGKEEKQGRVYARSYINAILMQELINRFDQEKAQNMAEELAGVQSIGGLLIGTEEGLRVRMQGKRDPDLSPEKMRNEDVLSDHDDLVASLLQEQTLLHYRTSAFDKSFFHNFFPPADRNRQYRELEQSVQKELGFSLDKFLQAVGPRAGISVHEIVNAGVFPLPKTIMAVHVRNKKAAGRALRRLRDTLKKKGFAQEHQEKVHGHRLYFWSIMPMEATHLAIALSDTMLYIANGESQLRTLLKEKRRAVDALKEKMIQDLGETAGSCAARANVSAFLLRPARLAEQIAPAADWLTDMTLANTKSSGKTVQKELLGLMRSFDVIAACRYRTETAISGEVIFKPVTAEK